MTMTEEQWREQISLAAEKLTLIDMKTHMEKQRKAEEQKLLDQFACAALQALLPGCHDRGLTITMVADDAYIVARAMLKARNEQA